MGHHEGGQFDGYQGSVRLVPLAPPKNDYNKPDLAQILVEGTKAVYGKEKAGQVQAEFEKLEKPHYRQNAEDLTAVVSRICAEPEAVEANVGTEIQTIDGVVESYAKPSMVKVAAKGTLNLVNKTCWYYPLLGALPGKELEVKARKRGENPNYYVISNSIVEGAAVTAGISYVSTNAAIASAIFYAFSAWFRIDFGLRHCKKYLSTGEEYFGSPIVSLLYYTPAVLKLIPKAFVAAGTKIKDKLVQPYASAYEEEQQKLLQAKTDQAHQQDDQADARVVTSEDSSKRRLGNPIVNWDLVNRDLNKPEIKEEEVEEEIRIRNNFTRL